MQAPRLVRVLLYVVFYLLPTVILFHAPIRLLFRIPIWFLLAFTLTFIYALVCKRVIQLRFEQVREEQQDCKEREEQFQSLNLRK